MSNHLRPIPLGGPRAIDRAEFVGVAQSEWSTAKAAYLEASNHMNSLMRLLYQPGSVRVSGRVTGAAHTAKQLRADVDRLIVALDDIVRAAKSVGEDKP